MTKRLYNTHESQGFVKFYNSQPYIFQPAGRGEYALVKHNIDAKTKRGKAVSWVLEKVSDRKMPNWLDVPDVLATVILTEGMQELNKDGEIDTTHHGGYIKEISDLTDHLQAEIAAKEKRIAELDAALKAKEKDVASVMADAMLSAKEPRKK